MQHSRRNTCTTKYVIRSIFIFIDLTTLFGIDMLESGCRRLGCTMQGAPTEALTFIAIGIISLRRPSQPGKRWFQKWSIPDDMADVDFSSLPTGFGFWILCEARKFDELGWYLSVLICKLLTCELPSLSYFRSPRTQSGKL